MRHCALRAVFLFLPAFCSAPTWATPVYLRPNSLFPSGHYERAWLEKRTREEEIKNWYHVQTASGSFGWIAEDHALTALKLSAAAFTAHEASLRREPRLESVTGRKIPLG